MPKARLRAKAAKALARGPAEQRRDHLDKQEARRKPSGKSRVLKAPPPASTGAAAGPAKGALDMAALVAAVEPTDAAPATTTASSAISDAVKAGVKSGKARSRLLASVNRDYHAVLEHDKFKADPLATLQLHMDTTLPSADASMKAAKGPRAKRSGKASASRSALVPHAAMGSGEVVRSLVGKAYQ